MAGERISATRPIVRLPVCRDEPAILMEAWWLTVLGRDYRVPAGFETDGASIPRPLQWACGSSMQTPRLYAAIWHDAAYSGEFAGMSRRDADRGYRALLMHFWRVGLVEDGCGHRANGIYARIHNGFAHTLNCISRAVAWIEYAALRLAGRSHWHANSSASGNHAGSNRTKGD